MERKKLIRKSSITITTQKNVQLLDKYKLRFATHPEQKHDEIWMGHTSKVIYDKIKWKTKRKGDKIFITNKLQKHENLFPFFVKISEYIEFYEGKFIKED